VAVGTCPLQTGSTTGRLEAWCQHGVLAASSDTARRCRCVDWRGGGGRWESAFKERLGAVNDVKAAEVEAVESLVKEQRKNKKSKQTPEERRAALEEAIRDTTVTHEGWL
jgi:hypothetical protein